MLRMHAAAPVCSLTYGIEYFASAGDFMGNIAASDALNLAARRAGTLQGVLMVLPITMAVMGLAVLSPVLPRMQAHFQNQPGAEFLVPLSLTLPALCVALLSPLAGVLVDFFGRRKTLISALILYAAVGILPMFLDSLMAIIASRALLGATEAIIVIASTTLIGDYFAGAEREKWLAYQTALASISAVFLFAIGGALGNLSWRAPFAVYALSLLYVVGLLLWTWEPRKQHDQTGGEPSRFPWRAMLPMSLLAIFSGIMFFMMMIQLSYLLTEYYAIRSPGIIGLYTAIGSLSVPLGTLVYRYLSKHAITLQLQIAFGFLGVTFVLMNYATTPTQLLGYFVVNQLGCGILLPALVVWAMGRLPFEFRGRGTGIFMAGWWIGQFLSPQALTLVRKHIGSLPEALQVFGVLCLAAAIIAFIGQYTRKPRIARGET